MRRLIIIFIFLFGNSVFSFAQSYDGLGWGTLDVTCVDYQFEGIAPLLQNKTWQMTQMYADKIPMDPDIAKSFQFVFSADSSQTDSTLILSMLRTMPTVPDTIVDLNFKYKINQSASTISLYHGKTGDLQKTFTVTCLTPGHLALTFPENGKDVNGNPKVFEIEYRFLVDYTWENQIIQNSLSDPNQ